MQMMYGLAGISAAVADHPVTAGQAFGSGNLGDHLENVGHHSAVFGGDAVNGRDVGLGDHQNVGGRLGRDIPESQDGLVLVDLGGGDIPCDDLAE